jgi:aryl-alcohol dehydrogenase-like predicted oxidoreductase
MDRRRFLGVAAIGAATACSSRRRTPAASETRAPDDARATTAAAHDAATAPVPETTMSTMLTRPIPRTGEALPVIGLGTWQTFDVGEDEAERAPCREVLSAFLAAGGRVVDSSPMYGRAETVTGDLVADLGKVGTPFLATKVWTRGKDRGIDEMRRSMTRMRTERMDLMQVHNLVDWKTHLPVLRAWKEAGTIRYLGVTHYDHGAFDELEAILRDEALDFIQLPYNLADRTAEKRLLPAARDTGTAVLVMRPFAEGALFDRVKGKALPAWAADFDCASWAQFFLKFLLGHPAVSCPIPATSKPKHLADNVAAGTGRLPDEATRQKMAALLDG